MPRDALRQPPVVRDARVDPFAGDVHVGARSSVVPFDGAPRGAALTQQMQEFSGKR